MDVGQNADNIIVVFRRFDTIMAKQKDLLLNTCNLLLGITPAQTMLYGNPCCNTTYSDKQENDNRTTYIHRP